MTEESFKGIEEITWRGHYCEYDMSLCSLRDGGLLSGSDDKTAKVWNPAIGQEKMTLIGHTSKINSVCQLKDGFVATASGYDDTIILWNVENKENEAVFQLANAGAECICPLSNGHLASASWKTASVWNIDTGEKMFSLTKCVRGMYLSSILQLHNSLLAIGFHNKLIQLWDGY